jgi:hypothetical protein
MSATFFVRCHLYPPTHQTLTHILQVSVFGNVLYAIFMGELGQGPLTDTHCDRPAELNLVFLLFRIYCTDNTFTQALTILNQG